ncbi:DUF6318 family protein [Paenarthrobacter ureafaciens]|uniref:DUF6318 family protein n=1 Tax=Paenarthrobacter ureafaciens TaxID=37931 RepID=UPI001F3D9A8F|nr:DUF6318 family protein [Paenarthrobacter ureafaciens]
MPYRPTHSFTPARLRRAGLALAAALLLTGCQGGTPSPPSTTTAEPTSSATTTGAPTPGASESGSAVSSGAPSAGVYKPADAKGKAENVPVPVMPELAKENSKEGLEAFIRYWYAQQNYAIESGDRSGWAPLNSGECVACARIEKGIGDSHTGGRWSAGGTISVPAIEPIWHDNSNSQQAKVQVVQQQIDYYNPDGSRGRPSESATNSAFGFMVKFGIDGWTVTNLGLIH